MLAGARQQAHTISPQNWLEVCTGAGLLLAAGTGTCGDGPSTEHLSVTLATPLLCSALLYLRTQQNIHIGLGGWAAAQQNCQCWRNEWIATLSVDMLGWG